MVDLLPADGVASHYTGSANDEPGEYVRGATNYVRHGVRADVEVLFSVHARGPFDRAGFDNFVCSVRHLGPEHVHVVVDTMGKVPPRATQETRNACETGLVAVAAVSDPHFTGHSPVRSDATLLSSHAGRSLASGGPHY